jgi:uncharacterized protein (TIGR00369 family)
MKRLLATCLHHWSPHLMYEAIRRQIGRSVPFARLLGVEIQALSAAQACTRLPVHRNLQNHVGSLHAGALFTACEAASGALLAGAVAELIMVTRLVVRNAQVEYLRSATGSVVARACLADDRGQVLQTLRRDGCAEAAVDVSAVTIDPDGNETLVARASFNWHLRLHAGTTATASYRTSANATSTKGRPADADR